MCVSMAKETGIWAQIQCLPREEAARRMPHLTEAQRNHAIGRMVSSSDQPVFQLQPLNH